MAVKKACESSVSLYLLTLLFLFLIPADIVSAQKIEGQLHIVAVMVEFQPEENPYTSGNGTFQENGLPYLKDPSITIDPLPHNQSYFEARLEFVKNYFERMSNSSLQISYQVIPQIQRVSGTLADYSPTGRDPDLSSMAALASEVWLSAGDHLAGEISEPNTDHRMYVIFHAGVGRDIELTGTTLKRTPQDLPSLYLDREAFRELLQDPSFSGFPAGDSNTLIDNTVILPRTLSREGEDLSGKPYVLQLSANGLATALTGRYLGLPDLFHTETGHSGIGRFGLMDGAAMFSYRGLFPPEMSAWEKIYAGWADAFTLPLPSDQEVMLPAASLRQPDSFLKIPVSGDEYFLVENRHRDPDRNGVTLTIQRPDGTLAEQTFTNDDISFTYQESGFEDLLEPGVVTAVSNYDFSLPGGKESSDGRILNGGILIWHVDEAVVRDKLGRTGINNDENHRAITLMEADGAQDIGRPAEAGLFQNEINGSPYDFWWSGNNSSVLTQGSTITLYQNRFGRNTHPANRTHSGATPDFELSGFSETLPVASFTYSRVHPYQHLYRERSIEPLDPLTGSHFFTPAPPDTALHPFHYPLAVIPLETESMVGALIPARHGLFFLDRVVGTVKKVASFNQDIGQPLLLNEGSQLAVTTGLAGGVSAPSTEGRTRVSLYDLSPGSVNLQWQKEVDAFSGFLSQSEPGWIDADHSDIRFRRESGGIHQMDQSVQTSEKSGPYQSIIQEGQLILNSPDGTQPHTIPGYSRHQRIHTGMIRHNELHDFYLLSGDRLTTYTEKDQYATSRLITDHSPLEWPAIVDLHQDGVPHFIYIEKEPNRLVARNSSGGLASSFPVSPPEGSEFTGTPLVADINGDGEYEIVAAVRSAYSLSYYAYHLDGKVAEGFPLMGGALHPEEHQPVQPAISGNHLIGVSPAGDLKMWEFPAMGDVPWRSAYGNRSNHKRSGEISAALPPPLASSLLDRVETYNWPNPASDHTFLRILTTEDAEVSVKIITLSGQTVYDGKHHTNRGIPQEIEIDTRSWSSGGYIGLVTAESGEAREQKQIRIAIVK